MGTRILGVDYGDTRTGIAVSDLSCFLASAVGTINDIRSNVVMDKIIEYAKQYDVAAIVLGDPINMNGTVGPRSEKARAFGKELSEKSGIPVIMYDERCSTVVAHTVMNATDTRGKKRKMTVDRLSAELILQDYLDSKKR
jgi:putative Holliday junction resolvase